MTGEQAMLDPVREAVSDSTLAAGDSVACIVVRGRQPRAGFVDVVELENPYLAGISQPKALRLCSSQSASETTATSANP